jgi:sterol-4alpha-carboxylate 3-dehydrogenase (decarboxylating)
VTRLEGVGRSNRRNLAVIGAALSLDAQFGHIPPFEVHIPLSLAWTAGMVAECFTWFSGGTTTLSRGSVRDACSMRYASGEKVRRILRYEAQIGIEDAIREDCET